MKSKREMLKEFVTHGNCHHINCENCSYSTNYNHDCKLQAGVRISQIGAMAILRMFPKKKKPILEVGSKIRFDNGKLYNIEKRVDLYNLEEYCLRDKNTMVCHPMDYLIGKIWEVVEE